MRSSSSSFVPHYGPDEQAPAAPMSRLRQIRGDEQYFIAQAFKHVQMSYRLLVYLKPGKHMGSGFADCGILF